MRHEVAVCPECRRESEQDEAGFLVCAEHGRLRRVVLTPHPRVAPGGDPPPREESDLGRVIGRCEAIVSSPQSVRYGEACGNPARHRDREGRPVCGMHRPEHLEHLRESCSRAYRATRGLPV